MKGWPLWKEVIKYHWCDVLFDRFYSREYSTLPVNDIWQDIAKRWTFEWGLACGLGINVFVFLFVFFRFISGWWLLIPLLFCIAFSFVLSSACSCIYLYIKMRAYYRSLDEAEKKTEEEDEYNGF
ncbi:MAG: hypothetical protein IJX76_01205 [Clostridia bacterium]|nr:hypothetical protein [Clostridia bacterium]